jgi:hypothetical protein
MSPVGFEPAIPASECPQTHALDRATTFLFFFFFFFFFFFKALNILVECFGLLNDLFPFPSILDAGYPVFDLHLADIMCDGILPSVLGSSL